MAISCAAHAAGFVAVQDANDPGRTMTVNSDGSINVNATTTPSGTADVNITEVGGNAVTTTVPVSGTVASTQSGTWKGGTYEFNASVIPTVQNAAYAAGQSLGGLQTISVGSTNSLTGMLNNIRVGSNGGSTVSVVAYVWSKNPSGTTCTDKTNFSVSQTDNAYLVAPPQLISLATVVSAQDATTYGAVTNLAGNFLNGSTNTNLYVCLLANASVTPATTSDYRLNLNGFLDVP